MDIADTYGFELNGNYEVSPWWHVTGSYSFFVENVENVDYVAGFASFLLPPGNTPRNMAYLQSSWDLGRNVSFDMMFRYVDPLALGVDSYFVGDIRLAWHPTCNLELSLVGQDLYEGRHHAPPPAGATEVEPGVYGMVTWDY